MLRPLISYHWSGCEDGNVIGIRDQLDVRRRCWKVGQIVIEEAINRGQFGVDGDKDGRMTAGQ